MIALTATGSIILSVIAWLILDGDNLAWPNWYITTGVMLLAALAWTIWTGKLSGVADVLKSGPATPENAAQARTQAAWISYAAYLPEALSVVLTLS
jgi:hypothetical protein